MSYTVIAFSIWVFVFSFLKWFVIFYINRKKMILVLDNLCEGIFKSLMYLK